MAMKERIYRYTDRPMTWTRAIVLGLIIWAVAIMLLGQIIEFTKKIPGVNKEGLNTTQIQIVRDVVANAVQNGFLVVMLAFAYFWQRSKQKRTGAKGLSDPVKGYMSGK
jgi:cbb3-type cytochrome oxidase subunit 1